MDDTVGKRGRKSVSKRFVDAEKLSSDVDQFVADVKVNPRDPFNMRSRLQMESSRLLERMEDVATEDIEIKTWYMALIAMWRMEAVGVTLRKEKFDEPNRGSSVRKYTAVFNEAHDTGGRKKITRGAKPAALPEPEPAEPDIESILNGDADDDLA